MIAGVGTKPIGPGGRVVVEGCQALAPRFRGDVRDGTPDHRMALKGNSLDAVLKAGKEAFGWDEKYHPPGARVLPK